MTKEQKNKILKELVEDRNYYARACQNQIERENGKISGADWMLERFKEILDAEEEEE